MRIPAGQTLLLVNTHPTERAKVTLTWHRPNPEQPTEIKPVGDESVIGPLGTYVFNQAPFDVDFQVPNFVMVVKPGTNLEKPRLIQLTQGDLL
jgi:hypothetical protein